MKIAVQNHCVSNPSRHIAIWFSSFLFCLAFAIGIYGTCVEPSKLDVRHVWINNHEMGQMFQKKIILQISDIHLHTFDPIEMKLLKTIEALQPDLIFLTGDYIKWNGAYDRALNFLAKVKAKDGVWAVMGDYDYSDSRKSCLFCHEPNTGKPTKRHTVKFLRNSLDKINTATGPVWIVGLDREADGAFFNEESLSFLTGKELVIVLSHSPLNFDLIDDNQNILMLAGDTHGGQIPLPSWFWKFLGYEKNARYEQGWFEKGKKRMYVSRGVGTSHFPFRFLRRPEITVFHFQAPEKN